VPPLMIFQQMQLMACAMPARRYATRDTPPSGAAVFVRSHDLVRKVCNFSGSCFICSVA